MAESELVLKARIFAAWAHDEQTYGDDPYLKHLDDVVAVLRRFGYNDPELLAAGYLHDVIEDTETTRDDLEATFGSRVADLVDAVTDGEGNNRAARKARPYRLIPGVTGAVLLKVADRIANCEAALALACSVSGAARSSLIGMYRQEQKNFEKALRGPSEVERMFLSLRATLELEFE